MPNIRGELGDYEFAELRTMRDRAGDNRAQQNQLGPADHQAFARMVTKDSAVKGAVVAAATVPYTALKGVAMNDKGKAGAIARRALKMVPMGQIGPRTTDASVAEVKGAFKGVLQGFGAGLKKDAARAAMKFLHVDE